MLRWYDDRRWEKEATMENMCRYMYELVKIADRILRITKKKKMGENAKKERSNIYIYIYMHILDAQSEADNGGSGGGRVVAIFYI